MPKIKPRTLTDTHYTVHKPRVVKQLNCHYCKRPVDKHAAKLGSGNSDRVCKACITRARAAKEKVTPA